MKTIAILIMALDSIMTVCIAQQPLNFPIPTGVPNQLFYLQRSQNINTVIYELNLKNGVVDSLEPVHIFWISYAEKSQREELTGIQRKYAYGLDIKQTGSEHYELRFLANKKYVFELKKGLDNKYHVFGTISNKPTIVRKIYLQINGGSLFSPNIEYVILEGTDVDTGNPITEQKKI